jgi:hypothetical protein
MSTTFKALDWLKNFKCEKGQLSNWPPIPYVTEMNIFRSKEEPQVLKVRLPNNSYLNMPIYSHGNTKEYLMHIVAVLCIIKQKELDMKCRKLGKAVVRQSGQLSNRPPIPYVTETGIVRSKEEPQVLKVRLPNNSHLNMPIYSRGNTKKHLTHFVAVLHIIKQKELDTK